MFHCCSLDVLCEVVWLLLWCIDQIGRWIFGVCFQLHHRLFLGWFCLPYGYLDTSYCRAHLLIGKMSVGNISEAANKRWPKQGHSESFTKSWSINTGKSLLNCNYSECQCSSFTANVRQLNHVLSKTTAKTTSFERCIKTGAVHDFWDTEKCEKLFSWLGDTAWVYQSNWLNKILAFCLKIQATNA